MAETELLPRERLAKYGADSLSDSELLAVLLRTGIRGCPVQQMASKLLAKFNGSLLGLCAASVEELCSIPGMGKTKSLELCAAFALSKRLAEQRLAERTDMKNPRLIALYMREVFNSAQQEEFHVLLLDCQMRLLRNERITVGLVDRSLVHAREVFRCAIRESCSYIIVCHNHPSGLVEPSDQDIAITQMLVKAGNIIGIKVIDHLIIGGKVGENPEYYSFMENGKMP